MKIRRILALSLLAALLLSIMPTMAFADINTFSSIATCDDSSVSAVNKLYRDSEGAEFYVVLNGAAIGGDVIYIASSRGTTDTVLVKTSGKWEALHGTALADGVMLDGSNAVAAESPAFIENGRTFLGVRDMGNAIGAVIAWDQPTQTATLSKDGIVVKVVVGANSISVTKDSVTSEIAIDAPAQNKDGRVYLPFRAVLEAFGYTVTWDQATLSVTSDKAD